MAKKLNEFLKEQFSKVIDEKQLIDLLKSNRLNVRDISKKFEVPVPVVWDAIDKLTDKKVMINRDEGEFFIDDTPMIGAKKQLNPDMWDGNWLRFGFVSDNHLGSHFERLEVLNLAYDIFEREGIKKVLNGGNMIDGEASFNKNEIHTRGFGRQIDYLVKTYPFKEGIETLFCSGDDHEGWYNQREGINSGEYMQMEREKAGMNDFKHLGYVEADLELNGEDYPNEMWLRLMHPGGGTSYAVSYTVQKIIESFDENEKPDILMVGHFHKMEYIPWLGVHAIQMGTTQDQSIFMRKKKIKAMVGFGILEVKRNEDGIIARVRTEFFPMMDKKFYKGKDKYWKS